MAIFYRPPADIDDFSATSQEIALRQHWHDYITEAISARDENLFFDAANDPTPGAILARLPIPWNGFPRSIWQWYNADADPNGPAQAFAAAEVLWPFTYIAVTGEGLQRVFPSSTIPPMRFVENGTLQGTVPPLHYRQQDEYCEWHIDRSGGQITRISFTAEGPEYWQRMSEIDIALVTSLYQKYVNLSVVEADLVWPKDVAVPVFNSSGALQGYGIAFEKGTYNPNNKWNTTDGVMHLTHPANTLGAEINLGADATVLFPSVSQVPANTFSARLICCARFGGVNRSSDPAIGAAVNGLAAEGKALTLENPVGLYIRSVDLSGLADSDGNAIPNALVISRASADGEKILRVEVRPPAGATYTLDQCTLDLDTLSTGGQIARKITMSLFGLAKQIPGRTAVSSVCLGKCCARPTSPSFSAPVPISKDCASVTDAEWAQFGPYTGTSESDNLFVAANQVTAEENVTSSMIKVAPDTMKRPSASRATY